ncbi:hypothetical protein Tsubulata_007705 [Turnera subulata]|uniref:Uncharacterized protein n=1 Tax=Turnera subulata TaxID=218843 RepID=A0A9Q0GA53_9ROSI|nr:hypothetical protein Tsubulata_007705 [Turnera subulata]
MTGCHNVCKREHKVRYPIVRPRSFTTTTKSHLFSNLSLKASDNLTVIPYLPATKLISPSLHSTSSSSSVSSTPSATPARALANMSRKLGLGVCTIGWSPPVVPPVLGQPPAWQTPPPSTLAAPLPVKTCCCCTDLEGSTIDSIPCLSDPTASVSIGVISTPSWFRTFLWTGHPPSPMSQAPQWVQSWWRDRELKPEEKLVARGRVRD